jgi:hypothetical protein
MVAPKSVKVFCNFSASSFGKFSFKVWGTDSTNFFAYLSVEALVNVKDKEDGPTSTRFIFGIIALTSLIIFAFAPASNFSNLTVKIVFSFGFSTSSAASAGAAAAAGPAEGIATSVIFNFVFNAVTSSETSKRDRVEICSTSGAILDDVSDDSAK